MIIEWPLKGQFHDAVTNVLASRTAVSGVVENVGNIIIVIYGKYIVEKNVIFGKMTSSKVFNHKTVRSHDFLENDDFES